MRILIAALLVIATLALPGRSFAEGSAIAFVQAVEMAAGICKGKSLTEALACARDKCIATGGSSETCVEQTACNPGNWSADIFVQHREGPHWHEYTCGWNDKAAVLDAVKVLCGGERGAMLIECSPVMLYDPDGAEVPVE